jgi:hypothetical protein
VSCGGDVVAGIQGSGKTVAAGVTVVGPISAFGSIFVDGVEYTTSGAQIHVDDESGTEADLRVGQIVTIHGTVDDNGTTGNATDVQFVGDLRGPAQQIDVSAGTFAVLGQTVRVTDATVFDQNIQPAELAGIQGSGRVQVSGFANASGEIIASRIDLTSSMSFQVRGTLQALDTTAHTFRINMLTVDYSGISPVGTLANGSVVTVQGATLSGTDTLIATRVQVFPGLGPAANDKGRLEGAITAFVSNADFTVNGQRVITDANTQFVFQGVALGLNAIVNVRGAFNASGVLLATRVEVRQRSLSIVRGLIDSVSASGNTLTVLGIAVATASTTSFEDRSDAHLRSLMLTDLRTGDYVEARGIAGTNGSITATFVERDKPEARSYLQGVVQTVAAPDFTILGRSVTTDAQTQFVGLGGPASSPADFFSSAHGQLVKVRGALIGNVFAADQVQIRQ